MFGFSYIGLCLRLLTKPHRSKSIPEARCEKFGVEMLCKAAVQPPQKQCPQISTDILW